MTLKQNSGHRRDAPLPMSVTQTIPDKCQEQREQRVRSATADASGPRSLQDDITRLRERSTCTESRKQTHGDTVELNSVRISRAQRRQSWTGCHIVPLRAMTNATKTLIQDKRGASVMRTMQVEKGCDAKENESSKLDEHSVCHITEEQCDGGGVAVHEVVGRKYIPTPSIMRI